MTAAAPPFDDLLASSRLRAYAPWFGFLLFALIIQTIIGSGVVFPAALDTFFADPIDAASDWGRANRRSHALFTGFFNPLTDTLEWSMESVESLLKWLPWFVLPAAVFGVIARTGKLKSATVAGLAMLYPGVVGLWDDTLETLALMTIAVLISVILGIPMGVWAALRPRVEQVLRPILDIMQTVPAFVYFLPLLVLFGVGRVNGAMATIIYALPPIVRLTTLGIRKVPTAAIDASDMFGATGRQTLFKVQLPMAVSSILAGLSQTIMMALGIVVLAALVAAGGLGDAVLQTLNQRRTGRGIAVGLAIVAIAMVLDRLGRSAAESDPTRRVSPGVKWSALAGLAILVLVGRAGGWIDFPEVWTTRVFDPIDTALDWARDNLSFITRPFNDFLVASVVIPVREFLTDSVAWPILVAFTAFLGWRVKGVKLALFCGLAVAAIGLVGLWEPALDTFVQVMVAVVLAVLIAVPVGIWAGRSPRVDAILGPLLDALQTIPSLVYIIPVVTLFTVGVVPGMIASVLYSIVPGIRITALGIQGVDGETLEASTTFGATGRQTLFGVRIPLAAPTIMAGVNQVIMMTLAMVIIAGLVGGGGLGFLTVDALLTNQAGLGFEVGAAIALIAMILDRLTQAAAERLQPPAAH